MRVDPAGSGPEAPTLPGYRIGAALGVGAGGPVWSAVRVGDGLPVAVKLLQPGAGRVGSPGTDGYELAALRAVRHPHVVRLVEDQPLAGGAVALVLERVEGGSLALVVGARGHLTPAETVTILTALGTTLADLHRVGLAHGDLSPGNVLFHPEGRPVLADLGLVRLAAAPDRMAAGTDGFVDPAVLSGDRAGPAADVYALAALGWYCLAGRPPGPPALRPALSPICPGAPAALVAAITEALDADPDHRVSAGELACAAYDACPAGPVTLAVGDEPADLLTRRIRVAPVQSPDPVPARRRHRVWRRVWRWVWRRG